MISIVFRLRSTFAHLLNDGRTRVSRRLQRLKASDVVYSPPVMMMMLPCLVQCWKSERQRSTINRAKRICSLIVLNKNIDDCEIITCVCECMCICIERNKSTTHFTCQKSLRTKRKIRKKRKYFFKFRGSQLNCAHCTLLTNTSTLVFSTFCNEECSSFY